MVILMMWGQSGGIQAGQTPAPLTLGERTYGLAILWSEVKYNFANFDLVPNLDWDQTFQEYLPQAAREQSNAEYYQLLQRFIALLQDGHTGVFPPASIQRLKDGPPILTESIEGKAIIVALAQAEEFRQAGLAPGVELTKIDGRSVAEVLQQDLYPLTAQSTPQGREAQAYLGLLRGPRGSRIAVEVRDLAGNTRTVTLTRDSGTPEAQRFYKTLKGPAVEMRRLPGGIVCFTLNSFGDDQAPAQFDRLFDGLANLRGMILDLRWNEGGNAGNAFEILTRLTDRVLPQGVSQARQRIAGQGETWSRAAMGKIRPRGRNPFSGPLVVLTSRYTVSAAEDCIVALQGNHRAIVVGGKTMGTTGQPIFLTLPGGGSARICTRKDFYPDGRPFVGIGIVPDVEVYPSQKDIAAGRDIVLEKGLEVLRQKMKDAPSVEVTFKTTDPALAEGDFYRRRGQVGEAIRSYKEALQLPPGAARAQVRLADLCREQGREKEALEYGRALGVVDSGSWMIIGPFEHGHGPALDTSYVPEQKLDFAKEYPGKIGTVQWFRYPGRQGLLFVDLASVLKPNEWTTAYAATCVYCPDGRNVQLRVGSDDEVRVWLNGTLVLNSNVPRYADVDQDVVPVRLQTGRNEVLVRSCNHAGAWGFYLRLTDVQGSPCAGLSCSPEELRP